MKLNKQSKDELRNEITIRLKKVPTGQRVQLDKELLEELLFDVVTLDKEKNIKVKIPVWSGETLKKLDLNQVDYTGVSWALLGFEDDYIDEVVIPEFERYGIHLDESTVSTIKKIQKDNDKRYEEVNGFEYVINYSGTNAKIDLSKSFEAIHGNELSIHNCNFAGLDFSKQDLTNINSIFVHSSDLSGTKLPIGNIALDAISSDFSGIDLSTKKIDGYQCMLGDYSQLPDCKLTDCGVQITLNSENFKDNNFNSDLYSAMYGDWVGCYVNGKKVSSHEEKEKNATAKRKEYKKMKEELFNSTFESIEKQIGHMKR